MFGMGHFWLTESFFWSLDGVFCTHVGYSGGAKENPCFGHVATNIPNQHALVCRVIYDPDIGRFRKSTGNRPVNEFQSRSRTY